MKKLIQVSVLGAALALGAGAALAQATIINPAGTVALGVNAEGHLNTSVGSVSTVGVTGLAYRFPDGSYRDATSPGCLCEGWGVSVNGTDSGFANVSTDGGANNLTVDSFVSGASTATSTVHLTSLAGISVTHAYAPSAGAPGVLFESVVTITNTTGATVNDVKYVRVMDWDVPPTEFSEFVTIIGTSTTTLLERSHDNGFNTANPLGGDGPLLGGTTDVDFTDSGPSDHGAYFRFNFGSLADGESRTFSIFYGAAGTEREAFASLVAVGAELYSYGQSSTVGGPTAGTPATFIFAFKGVGGIPVPEPGSLALLGAAMTGLAWARRRRAA